MHLELIVLVGKALQLALQVLLVRSKLPQLSLNGQLLIVYLLDH